MRTIIAICSTTGPQSGKSTLCRELKQRYPEALHMRFSDPLIRMLYGVAVVAGLTKGSYETFLECEYELMKRAEILPGITGRDFMVAAGDTLRKALVLSFYADILMKRILSAPDNALILIDDFRKQPEMEALLKLEAQGGAKVVFINVTKPTASTNDCEFDATELKSRGRLFEYTWNPEHPGTFVEVEA